MVTQPYGWMSYRLGPWVPVTAKIYTAAEKGADFQIIVDSEVVGFDWLGDGQRGRRYNPENSDNPVDYWTMPRRLW